MRSASAFAVFLVLAAAAAGEAPPPPSGASLSWRMMAEKTPELWLDRYEKADAAGRRRLAAALLGTGGSDVAHLEPMLLRAAGEPDLRTRVFAVQSLAQNKTTPAARRAVEASVLLLAEALEQRDDGTARRAAVNAAGALGPAAAAALPGVVQYVGDHEKEKLPQGTGSAVTPLGDAIDALRRIDPVKAVEGLKGIVKSDDAATRGRALTALKFLGAGPDVLVPPLVAQLGAPDPSARRAAAATLASMGAAARPAVPALGEMLQSKDTNTMLLAHRALLKIDPAAIPEPSPANRLVPPLVEKLRTGTVGEGVAAMFGLAEVGPPAADAVPDVLRFLARHRDAPELKRAGLAIAGVTAELGGAAVPHLVDAVRSDDPTVRALAVTFLGNLTVVPEARDGLAAAVPDLVRLIDDPDPVVARRVLSILAKLGPRAGAAVPALVERLGNDDLATAAAAARALARISPQSLHDHPQAQALVGRLTAELGKPQWDVGGSMDETLQAVGPAAAPAVPAVLKAAARLGRARAADPGQARYADPDASLVARAREIGRTGVPYLTDALDDPDPVVRRAAVRALAYMQPFPPEATPALRRAAGDPDQSVRDTAAHGLKGLPGLEGLPAAATRPAR